MKCLWNKLERIEKEGTKIKIKIKKLILSGPAVPDQYAGEPNASTCAMIGLLWRALGTNERDKNFRRELLQASAKATLSCG